MHRDCRGALTHYIADGEFIAKSSLSQYQDFGDEESISILPTPAVVPQSSGPDTIVRVSGNALQLRRQAPPSHSKLPRHFLVDGVESPTLSRGGSPLSTARSLPVDQENVNPKSPIATSRSLPDCSPALRAQIDLAAQASQIEQVSSERGCGFRATTSNDSADQGLGVSLRAPSEEAGVKFPVVIGLWGTSMRTCIQISDELLSVDGIDVSSRPFMEIVDYVRKCKEGGATMTFCFQRPNGSRYEATVNCAVSPVAWHSQGRATGRDQWPSMQGPLRHWMQTATGGGGLRRLLSRRASHGKLRYFAVQGGYLTAHPTEGKDQSKLTAVELASCVWVAPCKDSPPWSVCLHAPNGDVHTLAASTEEQFRSWQRALQEVGLQYPGDGSPL